MFNNKTTKNAILQDGTEITLSLSIKSEVDYNTFDELNTVLQAIKRICAEITDETLRGSSIEAVKDLFGITE